METRGTGREPRRGSGRGMDQAVGTLYLSRVRMWLSWVFSGPLAHSRWAWEAGEGPLGRGGRACRGAGKDDGAAPSPSWGAPGASPWTGPPILGAEPMAAPPYTRTPWPVLSKL